MIQKHMERQAAARKRGGFTIIEVMIVLAIAGLIMLIVFLAVPALQRSSRNTQRNSDVSAILGAVSDYISNNGGTLPNNTAADADGVSVDITSTTAGANVEPARLGIYAPAAVSITATPPTNATFPDKDHVVVVTGYTCNATGTGVGNASARTAAVLYSLEPAVKQCKEQ